MEKILFVFIAFSLLATSAFASEDSLVFKLYFDGSVTEEVHGISPADSTGSLVEDRFGNPLSAFLTSKDFEPLRYASNDVLEIDDETPLTLNVWVKLYEGVNENLNEVIVGKGSVLSSNIIEFEYGIMTRSYGEDYFEGGRVDYGIDPYGQSMLDENGGVFVNSNSGEWNFLTFKYDGVKWYSYLNAELIDSSLKSDTDRQIDPYFPFSLNREFVVGATYDSVYIDDISIYHRSLKDEEINSLHDLGTITGSETTVVRNLLLYPNPASSSFFTNEVVDVISVDGQVVLSSVSGDVDVSDLVSGMYLAKSDNGSTLLTIE